MVIVLMNRSSIEWTDSQLYIEVLGRVAKRAGISVVCDSSEGGPMTMVSGVPKAFEAFVMMCVSYFSLYLSLSLIV